MPETGRPEGHSWSGGRGAADGAADGPGIMSVRVDDFGEGMDAEIIDTRLTRLFSSSKDGELAAIVGWVDLPPEYLQQIVVTEPGGVVRHLHRFDVAGSARAHLAVGRTFLGSARVS